MCWPAIRASAACVFLAISLGACAHSDAPAVDPLGPVDVRVTLPPPPADVKACLKEAFPDIPDRALTARDVTRILGRAKTLDREKVRCGQRALTWIEDVRRDFARP